jgi:hypothetical protein
LQTFEIIRGEQTALICWGDSAEVSIDPSAPTCWRWKKRPAAPEEAVACQRQMETFLHRGFGREVLHGAAVLFPLGVVCICGPRGAGKSTLSAAMRLGGLELLADDDILLSEENGVLPNYPGSRLSAESASLLDLDDRDLDFDGCGKSIWLKSDEVAIDMISAPRQVIQAIVILENSEPQMRESDLRRTTGRAAFEIVWRQLKSPWMSQPAWRFRQFGVIASLVRRASVFIWNSRREAPAVMAERLLKMLKTELAKP